MKNNLLMADPADGGGKAEKKIKVKATLNPVRVGDLTIEPDVLDKRGKVARAATPVEIPESVFKQLGTLVTKVAALALLAFLAGAFNAGAQQYQAVPVAVTNGSSLAWTGMNGPTNAIAATTTNTCASVVALTKYDEVAIELTGKLVGAGTSAINSTWSVSSDGSNFTAARYVISLTAAGTTTQTWVTNLNVGAVGYLRLDTIGNANATAATNVAVRVWVKPKRNG